MGLVSFIAASALLQGALLAQPVNPRADDDFCATHTFGTICQPLQDSPDTAIGDHINLDLLVTGFPHSQAISIKLCDGAGKITDVQFTQFGVGDVGNEPSTIVSSRQRLIGGTVYPNAFQASFQFPCSLFDDGQTEGTFKYLLTHYYGDGCSANNTAACTPIIRVVPPLLEPRQVLIKDNAEICGRLAA